MSWHKILLPLRMDTCPDTVRIGKLVWDCYQSEKEPSGFAMFHATQEGEDGTNDKRVVYLSPVAASLCSEILESYAAQPCEVPQHNEPNVAFVFGDPRTMSELR